MKKRLRMRATARLSQLFVTVLMSLLVLQFTPSVVVATGSSGAATSDSCEYLRPDEAGHGDWTAYQNCLNSVEASSASSSSPNSASDEKCSLLTPEAQEAAGCNGNNSDSDLVQVIITNILYSVIFFSGTISVVYIVIGAVKYISSQGNAEAVKEGQKALLYASIGLAVTSLAFVIVNFTIGLIENNNSATTTEVTEDSDSDSDSDTESESDASSGPQSVSRASQEVTDWLDSAYIGAGPGDEVTNITLPSQRRLLVGDGGRIVAHITPYWLESDSLITWTSNHPEIATVNSEGVVNAKQSGEAIITARTSNGKTASTKIIVTKPIEPERIQLEPAQVNLTSGKKYNLTATVYPQNATYKHLTWSTDNAMVATVNSRGQVIGKKAGTANITAKTKNGKSQTIAVKVTEDDGETIKITKSLLHELDYFYQTNHHEPISSSCGSSTGSVSCGPAAYMASVYVLTKQRPDYDSFVRGACGRWMGSIGSNMDAIAGSNTYAKEYENRYHVSVTNIPLSWDQTVKEVKKGHPVILLVGKVSDSIIASQGYALTYYEHFVVALSYRNQGGGQLYIWSPVAETAIPGRNIGNCSEGECWYDKSAFQRNINRRAWVVKKMSR